MIGAILAVFVAVSGPTVPNDQPVGITPPAAEPCHLDATGVVVCDPAAFTRIMGICADALRVVPPAAPTDPSRSFKAFLYGSLGAAMLASGLTGVVPEGYTGTQWSLNVAGALGILTGLWLAVVPENK